MHFLRRYRDLIISILLLTLPFVFLNTNLKNPDNHNPLDEVVFQISSWIQHIIDVPTRYAADTWNHYVYLVDSREENGRLRRENARLREENRRFNIVQEESRRLNKMLGFRETFNGELVSARVIAKDTNRFFRVVRLRIDRSNTEVRPGMPVLTYDGLVGQVERTWGSFSDVQMLVDPSSSIDVVVQRTSSRGTLRGTGDLNKYACNIEYLRRTDEVRIGDLVFTSGAGRRFPQGILVGRITSITRRNFGLYQQAEVSPAVDLSRIREVFVHTNNSRIDIDDSGNPIVHRDDEDPNISVSD